MVNVKYFSYGAAGLAMVGAMGTFLFGGNPFVMLISGVFCLVGAAGAVGFY